jgi:tripartite-type tricarboxylate transporter receptor subunit TctC
VIDRINAAVVRVLKAPDVHGAFNTADAEPVGSSPEQYTAFVRNETVKWAKVIKAAGIKGA